MSASEIARLEARWRENPQGLTFAPLAEAYRKLGETDRALTVLGEGLQHYPDYIPASIVLGRCHLDRGDRGGAESAFRHVLELDGENVIALKALADLAERDGRADQAGDYLESLLRVDPENGDARAQLGRLSPLRTWRAPEPALAPPAPSGPDAGTPGSPEEPDRGEPVAAEPLELVPDAAAPDGLEPGITAWEPPDQEGTAPAESVLAASPLPEPAPPVEGLMPESPPAVAADDVPPLEGLVGVPAPAEPGEPAAGFPADVESEWEASAEEITLESNPDSEYSVGSATDDWAALDTPVTGGSEYQLPSAAEELTHALDPAPSPDDDPWSRDVDLTPATAEAEAPPEPVAAPEPAPEPAGAAAAPRGPGEGLPEPELVVTESMAELYIRQGHRSDAVRVYRELALRAPHDERLRARLQELEAGSAAVGPTSAGAPRESVGGWLARVLAARPVEVAGAPPAPAANPAADAEAEPTRPAGDHLSLTALFGDDAPPVPPAAPAPEAAPDAEVSFDAFFGSASEGAGRTRPGARDDDDLDQFHTWLQSLKR